MNEIARKLFAELKDIDHIIWDWNGTLLDDVDFTVETVNHFLQEYDLPLMDRDRYKQIFNFPVRDYYDVLGFDYAKESFESLCERFVDRFMADVLDLPLVKSTESLLHKLHGLGMKQSVLSATDQSNLEVMVKHYGLNGVFTHVYGIDNKFAASKVARGHELIQISGIPVDRTVIIGDTLHDLEVARELGIHAVLVGHGHQCPTRLSSRHNRVIF